MAANTEGPSSLYVQAAPDREVREHPHNHPLPSQDAQSRTPYTTAYVHSFVSPSIPYDREAQIAEHSSQNVAESPMSTMQNHTRPCSPRTLGEPVNPARHSPLEVKQALEVSLNRKFRFIFRFIPRKVRQRVVEAVAIWVLDSLNSTNSTNEQAGGCNSSCSIIHSQQEQFDSFESNTRVWNESPIVPNIAVQPFSAPQNLSMLRADFDRWSMQGSSSEGTNKYQTHVFVKDMDGRIFKVPVQFDTGADTSVISRGTLNKLLVRGKIKIHPIPPDRLKGYSSPIDGNATQPQYFIFVGISSEKLNFDVRKAMFKIIERPEDIPIIIGCPLIDELNTSLGTSLLARLEQLARMGQLNDDSPIAEARPMVGALFKERRTKGMQSTIRCCWSSFVNLSDTEHQAIDKAFKEKHKQDCHERQKILATSSSPNVSGPAGYAGSRGPPYTGTMPDEVPANSRDWQPMALQKSSSHPMRVDDYQSAAQKMASSSFAGFPDPRRTDTSSTLSTQYTQYTQYSMSRQSTTSTVSSWGETASHTTKIAEGGAAPRTRGE
jgi:hypothetical protein